MKKRLFTVLISCVIFVFLLLGAEFLLGALSDQLPEKHVPKRHVLLKEYSPGISKNSNGPKVYLTGSELNGTSREVRFEIDEKGYIKPSNVQKDPDVIIAFLGGSTTECSFVDESKRFPFLVGELLNEGGFKANTLNAAVAGNNSAHTLNIYLNKVLIEGPDIAVMMHNVNDLHELIVSKAYWDTNGQPTHIITENVSLRRAFTISLKSVLPNIALRFDNMMSNSRKESPKVVMKLPELTEENKQSIFRQFEENLKLFASISRIKGITPVLMTQGSRFGNNLLGIEENIRIIEDRFNMPFEEYKKLHIKMNQIIRDVCDEEGVLMIDLEMLSLPDHMYDAVHYNNEGSEFVANKIAEHLTPLVKELISE